jgi:hypothetical protein
LSSLAVSAKQQTDAKIPFTITTTATLLVLANKIALGYIQMKQK